MKQLWCECQACTYVWVGIFVEEFGCLVAAEYGEECPECGSDDLSVGEEYTKGSEL